MSGKRQRPIISTPFTRRDPSRRGPLGIIGSLLFHAVGMVVLVRIAIEPRVWDLFQMQNHEPVQVEHVGMVALPRTVETPRDRPKAGGNDRVENAEPVKAAPPVIVPTVVPQGISEPSKASGVPAVEGGSGPLVGGGGPTKGVRPSYSDPRVWIPPGATVRGPKTNTERLDSAVMAGIQRLVDSIDAATPGGRKAGDWTVTKNGQKYGIDQQYIHFGKFSLPTALLALLPINAQGNPAAMERDRRLSQIRSEIQEQAARMARDDDFRAAVQELRQRKERERAQKRAVDDPAAVPTPVPASGKP